jgi:hypothetical protein
VQNLKACEICKVDRSSGCLNCVLDEGGARTGIADGIRTIKPHMQTFQDLLHTLLGFLDWLRGTTLQT